MKFSTIRTSRPSYIIIQFTALLNMYIIKCLYECEEKFYVGALDNIIIYVVIYI